LNLTKNYQSYNHGLLDKTKKFSANIITHKIKYKNQSKSLSKKFLESFLGGA